MIKWQRDLRRVIGGVLAPSGRCLLLAQHRRYRIAQFGSLSKRTAASNKRAHRAKAHLLSISRRETALPTT